MASRIINDVAYTVFTEEELISFIAKRRKTSTDIMLSGTSKVQEPISFEKFLFTGDVFIADLHLVQLEFSDCIFEMRMLLQNLEIDRLLLVGCQFLRYACVDNCNVSEFVEIRDGRFHKQFKVDGGSYQDFEIKQDAAKISIEGGTFKDLHICSGQRLNNHIIHVDEVFLSLSKIEGTVLCEEFDCGKFGMKGNIQASAEI